MIQLHSYVLVIKKHHYTFIRDQENPHLVELNSYVQQNLVIMPPLSSQSQFYIEVWQYYERDVIEIEFCTCKTFTFKEVA